MAGSSPTRGIGNILTSLFTSGNLATIVRFALGMLFLVASVEKIADPNAFAQSIDNYRIFPHSVDLAVASILPWLELLCGLGLLFGIATRGSAFLAVLMLLGFTLAVASALVRGLDISCGCFTQDPQVGKIAWQKVAENLIMTLAALLPVFARETKLSLESFIRTHAPDVDASH